MAMRKKIIPLTFLTLLTFGASGGADCGTSKYSRRTETPVLHVPKFQKTHGPITQKEVVQPQHVFACANSTSSAGSAGGGFAAGGTAFVEAWTSVNTRTATQNHLQLLSVWDMFGTNSRWPFPLQVP
jgi:hypothetical protein